jgi:hypothetical protein
MGYEVVMKEALGILLRDSPEVDASAATMGMTDPFTRPGRATSHGFFSITGSSRMCALSPVVGAHQKRILCRVLKRL